MIGGESTTGNTNTYEIRKHVRSCNHLALRNALFLNSTCMLLRRWFVLGAGEIVKVMRHEGIGFIEMITGCVEEAYSFHLTKQSDH
jgi:hypothetical protein